MIRIVSWNMNYWARSQAERDAAWGFLGSLKPTFALLQEARPPGDLPSTHCVYRAGGISKRRPWGSAVVSFNGPISRVESVVSRYSSRPAEPDRTHPGNVAVATTVTGLTLVSVYGLIEVGYAVTSVHRQLSDLTPLFDSDQGRNVVLAGDLNLSTQLKKPHRGRHRNALERIESLGLTSALSLQRPPREPLIGCPCSDTPCKHVRTLRHRRSATPWQNDYFYVSASLGPVVTACYPVDGGWPDPWGFSDHCPIVLELEGGLSI